MNELAVNIHPQHQRQVVLIGRAQLPVVVMDNFVDDPRSLIEYAVQYSRPTPDTGFYPGLRSPAPPAYETLMRQLIAQLAPLFKLSAAPIPESLRSYYSMVITAPANLNPIQRIPHFDQASPSCMAAIHFLCGEEHGGTSFYRHKASGLEFISQQKCDDYLGAIAQEIRRDLLPQANAYINGDTLMFERIKSFSAKFNRLLLYPGSYLHSGDIPMDFKVDMNPFRGRFTITSFSD